MKHLPAIAFLILSSLIISCTPADTTTDISEFEYADSAEYGPNLLDTNMTKYYGSEFSFSAVIPTDGKLTVKLKKLTSGNWFISTGTETNWAVSSFDSSTGSQTFTAISAEKTCDMKMEVLSGKYEIEYYENESNDPTRVKQIEI